MPPKNKFTKEQIIDAAFDIAKEEGLDSVVIRKVADRIGSSIAPIYVNFDNVEELKSAVIAKLVRKSKEILDEQDSGSPFLDIGMASLFVARDFSALFMDLIMKPNTYLQQYNQAMEQDLIARIQNDQNLQGFNEQETMNILLKMKIFQTGLSVMVANKLLPEVFSEDTVKQLLAETGNDVIAAARLKSSQEQ